MSLTLDDLRPLFTEDRELKYKLKGFTGRLRVVVGDLTADLIADNGTITGLEPGSAEEARLSVVVPADVLDDAVKQPPVPGTESLMLATGRGAGPAGDLFTDVAPYAGATGRVYQLLRQARGVTEIGLPTEPAQPLFADTDTAVGRYVYVTFGGTTYRVYYEESGTGDEVLLLQHTAGCDARQWRHQLADPEFQSRYRLIAYDLPFHGRSLPPVGPRWWEEAYQPAPQWYWDFVVAFADALGLEHPHFMGCSVGGQLALDLAAYRGDRFGAFFALNGTLDNARADEFTLGFNDLCRDNRVSTEIYGSGNFAATSPLGPEPYKREIYWIYRSNFPGVYAGDNDYFLTGHDLTKGEPRFDTENHPVYVIGGEYDPMANDPEHGGPAVAERFPGIRSEMLPGLSHFAPTDDPLGFRAAILPLLEKGINEYRAGTGS
ncbi:alpha/beta fold hydrolase [Amycolatopsis sp. YIM 10]|uniref:alpha/beta fold hydrolase n=1 Tax=Amycolatopsis sp. YIM 10 TaxID=2653857 RepID=UPI00129002A2|nr:alpha/beta hydrolase [Amycolatopsis sp. YIM 10]QFU89584.1 2-hydroxy-6-oxononadienedioate/2-hydroxy-6-oxononatrienedioate hydrolase [Amycolatopsis sp. YIM 10]